MKWLFLVHQVQTPNSRERVKVWRMTKKVGAILYRNSVYVLPYSKERLEDFQWLCQQIRDSEGEASVFVSEADTREEDRLLRQLFEKTREREYDALLERLRRIAKHPGLTTETTRQLEKDLTKLKEEFTEVQRVDFFPGTGARSVRKMLEQVTKELAGQQGLEAVSVRRHARKEFQNKLWATRKHIHIDRLCSAWLISRFIDPKARFAFADESRLPKGAVHFDVVGAELSHRGDNCTFETLLKAFDIKDPALTQIGEIVHDIDMKDKKFGRPEATGVDMMVRTLSDHMNNDEKVLSVGSLFLDGLYEHFSGGKRK